MSVHVHGLNPESSLPLQFFSNSLHLRLFKTRNNIGCKQIACFWSSCFKKMHRWNDSNNKHAEMWNYSS